MPNPDDFLFNGPSESEASTVGESLSRRHVLAALAGVGVGAIAFQRALAAQASTERKP